MNTLLDIQADVFAVVMKQPRFYHFIVFTVLLIKNESKYYFQELLLIKNLYQ